jgi:hypothetical protein
MTSEQQDLENKTGNTYPQHPSKNPGLRLGLFLCKN